MAKDTKKVNKKDLLTATLENVEIPIEEVVDINKDIQEEEIVVDETISTEKTEEKTTMTIENVKQLDYAGRGFTSIDEAFAFIDTKYFKGLGKEDQEEFINWLY